MNDLSTAPRARLITALGTVLYFDVASGELRHGPIESSPANAVFAADSSSAGPRYRGWLMHDADGSCELLVCHADRCHATSQSGANGSALPTVLELIQLERGLIAFKAGDFFLSAIPDGRISLSAPVCSTWELFLASEDWCTDSPATGDEWIRNIAGVKFDKKRIESYIVHPLIRVRANTKPKAKKLLIYGYTKWSHGRVYYDLCKQLHRRGYIVDVLDWQGSHTGYVNQILSYYDLCMTALDGVRTLVDTYGVPYDKIIALSHHEFDMRMLIEQKGIEVFEKFANYGVVSEYLYSASLMRGVPRAPMVAALGINFSDFYAEIPEGLATVGYAGSMSVNTFGVEWKRGELAEASAREAGLAFKVAGWTGNQISFHDMPDFYRTADAVLATSISEGAGLPVMEAAAAGRLVIGTPVGHFPLKAYQGGGILAPIEAEKFKAFTIATLKYYKDNSASFQDKCRAIQEAARKFDWQYSIGDWIDLIESANSAPGQAQTVANWRHPVQHLPEHKGGDQRSLPLNTVPRGNLSALQQIHLINLDRSTDRLAKFKERNYNLENVLRISAIDGTLANREELVKDGTITEDLCYFPGSLGCALSHLGLWKKADVQNRIVTIFEDDVICSRNFKEEFARVTSLLPADWDVILWGYCFHPLFMWLDLGFSKAKLQSYDRRFEGNYENFQFESFSSAPVRIAHVFGTMAYSVSPKGARALLERCLPLRKRLIPFPGTGVVVDDTGIDCSMCAAYSSMQAFVCIPPLVIHDQAQMSDRVVLDR